MLPIPDHETEAMMMAHIRKHRQRIAAALLAVMMFALLHPAVLAMTVIQRGEDALLVEVCTAHGVSWVSLDQADASVSADERADEQVADENALPTLGAWPDELEATTGTLASSSLAAEDTLHCPMCFLGDALPVDFDRADLSFPLPGFVASLSQDMPWLAGEAERIILMAPPRAPPDSGTKTNTPDMQSRLTSGSVHVQPALLP